MSDAPRVSFPALGAHRLSKRYRRGVDALRDVDLAIESGVMTALVGPNGAGKSTLIKTWMGFERPTAGHASVLGIDPWTDRGAAVAHLGYVPETVPLYRDLSVADHLVLARTLRGAFDAAYAARRLDRLGISRAARPTELSGGQRAQVALAIALGTRAEILLLDEPLATLDPLARREFLAVVGQTVREEGTTVLLSSHLISDVEQACRRLVILAAGRVLLDETVAAALAGHCTTPAALALTGSSPVGAFPGRDGEMQRLWRIDRVGQPGDPSTRPASLEEVALGYLASVRPATGA